jgi:hypothetical protein
MADCLASEVSPDRAVEVQVRADVRVIRELSNAVPRDRGRVGVELCGDERLVDRDAPDHLDSHAVEMAARRGYGKHVRPRSALISVATVGRSHESDLVERANRCLDHLLDPRRAPGFEREKRHDVACEDRVAMRAGEQ